MIAAVIVKTAVGHRPTAVCYPPTAVDHPPIVELGLTDASSFLFSWRGT